MGSSEMDHALGSTVHSISICQTVDAWRIFKGEKKIIALNPFYLHITDYINVNSMLSSL